ncbi:MAG: hypothetical protein AAB585_02805 [Patescibacteria group bacterium]
MWCKIEKGIGEAGKLWTGSEIKELGGKYAKVELVEFHSPESGASTRRLFIRETRDEAPEGIRVPTLHISTGGVGSLMSGRVTREQYGEPTTPRPEDAWLMPLLVWNWSGRVGGYLILDPVATESGYVRRDEVNSALPGFAWIHAYEGSTLSEYVLVRTRQTDPNEGGAQPAIASVDERHTLPIHRVVNSLLSPPEREAKEKAETLETEAPAEIAAE